MVEDDKTRYIYLGTTTRKVTAKKGSKEERVFASSRQSEVDELLNDRKFDTIHESNIPASPTYLVLAL